MEQNKTPQAAPVESVVMPERPNVAPSILVGLLGLGQYMMPPHLLPIMDCDNCRWRQEQWRDGGHCYMFREKPSGKRCGQMKTA